MSRSPNDSGESLVEILLSITIMGIAVTALLLGMGTAATTSGLHTRQAQQAEVVRNVIGAVQALPYVSCSASYATASAGVPSGYSATASVVPQASTCPASDPGVQQVRVTVTQADDRIRSEVVSFVKRKPCPVLPC